MSDMAHLLFPGDVPKEAPEWHAVQHEAAQMRLSGRHEPAADAGAALVFPSEAKPADNSVKVDAATGKPDAAKTLFKSEARAFNDTESNSFFDQRALSAIKDGERDRGQELAAAKDALVSDMKSAGTAHVDFNEALGIVSERMGGFSLPSPDEIDAERASSMATLTAEGVTESDLSAARAFIADLERIAPGTVRSLEKSGAGNDPKLIRKAIQEARRRGYK